MTQRSIWFISFILFAVLSRVQSSTAQTFPEFPTPLGKSYESEALTISEDGAILVVSIASGQINVWDIPKRRFLRSFSGHNRGVTCLGISPDKKHLISGGYDNTVKVWSTQTGHLISQLEKHKSVVSSCAFYSDSTFVTGSYDRTLKFWKVGQEEPIRSIVAHFQKSTATTTITENRKNVRLRGKSVYKEGGVYSIAISDNDQLMASGGFDRKIKIRSFDKLNRSKELKFHFDAVNAIEFSNDNNTIISGGNDGWIKVWDVETGEHFNIGGHQYGVNNLTLSADEKYLISSGVGDSTLRLWETNTWTQIDSLADYDLPRRMVKFIGNSHQFCFNTYQGYISIGEIVEGSISRVDKLRYGFYNSPINTIEISRDKTKLAIGDSYGATVLDLVENRVHTNGTYSVVNSIHMFNDGGHIVYGGQNGSVTTIPVSYLERTFKTDSAEQSKIIEDIEVISATDSLLFACHGDWKGNITYTVSNFYEDRLILKDAWSIHKGIVTDLLFLPQKHLVASSSNDNTVKFFDISTLSVVKTMKGPSKSKLGYSYEVQQKMSIPASDVDKGIASITSISNEKFLAIGGVSGSIEVYDLEDYSHQFSLPGHQSPIRQLEGVGNLLISGSKSGNLKFWDIEKRLEIASFDAHDMEIRDIAITNDQKFAFTVSADHSIKLWDLHTRQLAATIIISTALNWKDDYFVFTPQGHFDWGGDFDDFLYLVNGLKTINIDQIKDEFYTPRLLQRLILDNEQPLRQVDLKNIKPYPDVTILKSDEADALFEISLIDQGGGIGPVRVWINGKQVTEDLFLKGNFKNRNKLVFNLSGNRLLKNGDNEITFQAGNELGSFFSEKVSVNYFNNGIATGKPSLYGIVVGTSEYEGNTQNLHFAAKDASQFSKALGLVSNQMLDSVFIELFVADTGQISGKWPSKKNLRETFLQVAAKATSNDILVVFLSGHGTTNMKDGSFYYLTSQFKEENRLDSSEWKNYAISSEELITWINEIPILKQVVILDACNSGRVFNEFMMPREGLTDSQLKALDQLDYRTGTFVLAGAESDQQSYETSNIDHGFLTYCLLEGMKGEALKGDLVDVQALFQYAIDQVPKMTSEHSRMQRPVIRVPKGGSSFPIGISDLKTRSRIELKAPKHIFRGSVFFERDQITDIMDLQGLFDTHLKKISKQRGAIEFRKNTSYPDSFFIKGAYSIRDRKIDVTITLEYKGQPVMKLNKTFLNKEKLVDYYMKEIILYLHSSNTFHHQ